MSVGEPALKFTRMPEGRRRTSQGQNLAWRREFRKLATYQDFKNPNKTFKAESRLQRDEQSISIPGTTQLPDIIGRSEASFRSCP